MKNKVYASFDEAVADVPDGATFMSGGFASIGVPRNLISALVRQGAKELTGISNNSGGQGEVVDVGKLVENGQIRKMVCAFTAAPHPSRAAMFEKLHEQGLVEAELVPQGTLVERMRAAGAGIGAFYTPTGVGTETAEGKEQRVINGRTYVLEYPLPADYAFVRAYRADTFGNLQFRTIAAQLQPRHGHGRQNHHRRGRGGHRGARRNGPGHHPHAWHRSGPDSEDTAAPGGHLGHAQPAGVAGGACNGRGKDVAGPADHVQPPRHGVSGRLGGEPRRRDADALLQLRLRRHRHPLSVGERRHRLRAAGRRRARRTSTW